MNHFKIICLHFTGVTPEGDIFSNITLLENSELIAIFTACLTDVASNINQAKRIYLEMLASGISFFHDRSNPDYNN